MCLSPRLNAVPDAWVRLSPYQVEVRDRVRSRMQDGTYAMEIVPCFCGGTDTLTLAKRDRYGLPVTTVLCSRCGLLRTSPRMSRDATTRFYREDYRALYEGERKENDRWAQQTEKGETFFPVIMRLFPETRTVYEVGCGMGGILLPFARNGLEVTGCDYDEDYLAVGRAQGLNLVRGNAAALLDHCGKKADLVLLVHVLEHFLDLREELKRVAALVRPGGILLVEVPGIRSVQSFYQNDLLMYLQNAHTYHFSAATLGYVLASAGLEVLHIDEEALAIAQRPLAASLRPRPSVPAGEARTLIRFLAETEKTFLRDSPTP